MSERGQAQKAGSNSQQIQVAGDLIMGVTEDRAREIIRENFRDLYAQYSAESHAVAEARVVQLQERLIPELVQSNLLGALGDPAFQVTLRKAQLGAASTDRDGDYDMLAGLLQDRAARANNLNIRAGINRAVEIVDQLDDAALSGLTIFATGTELTASSPSLDGAMGAVNAVMQQVMQDHPLPEGRDWIDHLEILSAVRISETQSFVAFPKYWATRYRNYVSKGVAIGSDEAEMGIQSFAAAGLQGIDRSTGPTGILSPHELKPGWLRWNATVAERIFEKLRVSGWDEGQIEEVRAIGRDVYGADVEDPELVEPLMERVRTQPYLAAFEVWWGTLRPYFTLTVVGKVLARANARNLDSSGQIPPID